MLVVFGTNIYVSAFAIPGGRAEEAYLKAVHSRFEPFTSVAILTETAGVLQTKFEWMEDRIRQVIQDISLTATVLRPRPTLHLLKDEPDNRILECAQASQAECIVTGDHHLLSLKRYESTTIISLADFLKELERT